MSEPAPASLPVALHDLANLAYHRQPALRVRFLPGQLEDVFRRSQGREFARAQPGPARRASKG